MRGKTAREIRKALNYHPKNKREYKTFTMCVKKLPTYQYDLESKEVKLVQRDSPRYLTECISGDRKIYQGMKRHYTSLSKGDLELQFSEVPSDKVIDDLMSEYDAELEKITKEVTNETSSKENENE